MNCRMHLDCSTQNAEGSSKWQNLFQCSVYGNVLSSQIKSFITQYAEAYSELLR